MSEHSLFIIVIIIIIVVVVVVDFPFPASVFSIDIKRFSLLLSLTRRDGAVFQEVEARGGDAVVGATVVVPGAARVRQHKLHGGRLNENHAAAPERRLVY